MRELSTTQLYLGAGRLSEITDTLLIMPNVSHSGKSVLMCVFNVAQNV